MIGDQPLWDLFDDGLHDDYEDSFFDSVASEFNDIGGFPVEYYVKLVPDDIDDIYGEDPNEEFEGPYRTKLVYQPTDEASILDMFGITSDDTLEYAMITKSIFERDVINEYGDYEYVPKPGDVVKTLWNNKMYELAYVGSEQKIFHGVKMIWDFIMKPYRHSEESDSVNDMLFDTPDSDDFPTINVTTESEKLSAYGDNTVIQEESDNINQTQDSSIYGY